MTDRRSTDPIDVALLEEMIGSPVRTLAPLRGGDVANSFRVEMGDGGRVFAKTHPSPPPAFFSTEAAGLNWLADGLADGMSDGRSDGIADDETGRGLRVPRVLGYADSPPLLVLAWIDQDRGGNGNPARVVGPDEVRVGRALAALHRAGAPCFGREDRRTTGSRGLPNDPADTWVEFFAERRLLVLARLARDEGALGPGTVAAIESVAGRLAELGGPPEPPARLHGDLWAGNRIVDGRGQSWLIDPAAHGGHREFDLAMMRLFGGFGPEVFAAYDEAFPLADGWAERVALHQLAPLIVHAVKFGGGYGRAVDEALRQYR